MGRVEELLHLPARYDGRVGVPGGHRPHGDAQVRGKLFIAEANC